VWSLTARDEASLAQISGAVDDAYIDGPVEYDQAAGVVTLPLLQEGWPDGPPADCLPTRETWRYREYRVTFFRARLVVRRVQALQGADAWTDGPMIDSVTFDARRSVIWVRGSDDLLLTVGALDVEVVISREPGGHVRRRVGKLTGAESDRWLDQRSVSHWTGVA
jgi:hypothetical protein